MRKICSKSTLKENEIEMQTSMQRVNILKIGGLVRSMQNIKYENCENRKLREICNKYVQRNAE